MTRILRTRDPKAVEYMIPHFTLPGGDEEKEAAGQQLMQRMTTSPESVVVFQAWRGEDIVGFIIAFVSENPFVWVAQGWSRPGNPWVIADELFRRVLLWGMALGRTSIRAETSRDLEAMYSRFGFKPVASIVERRITPEEISSVLSLGKAVVDG